MCELARIEREVREEYDHEIGIGYPCVDIADYGNLGLKTTIIPKGKGVTVCSKERPYSYARPNAIKEYHE